MDSGGTYDQTFSRVAEYIFARLHYGYPRAVRTKAGETLGLMSKIRFERIIIMYEMLKFVERDVEKLQISSFCEAKAMLWLHKKN